MSRSSAAVQNAQKLPKKVNLQGRCFHPSRAHILVILKKTMHWEKATVPAYWQVGGARSGGCKRSSRLHVVTVGLLAKWVAENPAVLLQYEHVILDEYDGAAADVHL